VAVCVLTAAGEPTGGSFGAARIVVRKLFRPSVPIRQFQTPDRTKLSLELYPIALPRNSKNVISLKNFPAAVTFRFQSPHP
jgi:hypothetical protein